MKLNLGSNDIRYKDFLNVDIQKIPSVDIVDDVFKLETIKENSIEHIIAYNILEHISSDKTLECVKLWVSKLKQNGIIQIGVPDGELIFNNYLQNKNIRKEYKDRPWENVIHSIFGNMKLLREWHGNDAEKYMHHTLFSKNYLIYIMETSGLKNIEEISQNHPDNITLKAIKL